MRGTVQGQYLRLAVWNPAKRFCDDEIMDSCSAELEAEDASAQGTGMPGCKETGIGDTDNEHCS